jgi:hypothetical protein
MGFEIAISRIASLVFTGEFIFPVVRRTPCAIAILRLGRSLPACHRQQDPDQGQSASEPRPAAGPPEQIGSAMELHNRLNSAKNPRVTISSNLNITLD